MSSSMAALPFSEWTREQKDEFAEKRMQEMKLKNERAKQRHAEVEQDRLKAEAKNSSVTSSKIDKKGRSSLDKAEAAPKYEREWDIGKCDPDSEDWSHRDWSPPESPGFRSRCLGKSYPDKQMRNDENWRAPNIYRNSRGFSRKPFTDYQRSEASTKPGSSNFQRQSGNDTAYKSFHNSRFNEEMFSNVKGRSSSPNHDKPYVEAVKGSSRIDNYQTWRDVEVSDVQNKQSRVEKWVKSLNASSNWGQNEDTVMKKEYYPSEGKNTNSQYDLPNSSFDSDKYPQTHQLLSKETNLLEFQNSRGKYEDNGRNNSCQYYSRGRGRRDFPGDKTVSRFDNKNQSGSRFNNYNRNRFREELNDYCHSKNWQEADHDDRVKVSRAPDSKYSKSSDYWEDAQDYPPDDHDQVQWDMTPDTKYANSSAWYEEEYSSVGAYERGKANYLKDARSSGSSVEQTVWYGKEHANSKSCENANWSDISIESTPDNRSNSKNDKKNKFNKKNDFNSSFEAKGRYKDEHKNYSASSRNNSSATYQRTQYNKNYNNDLHASGNETEAVIGWEGTDLDRRNMSDTQHAEATTVVKSYCPQNQENKNPYSRENESTNVDMSLVSKQMDSNRLNDLTDDSWKPLNNKLVKDWSADWSDVAEIDVKWDLDLKEDKKGIVKTTSEKYDFEKSVNSDKMYKNVLEELYSEQLMYSDNKICETLPEENDSEEQMNSDNKICETLSVELISENLMNSNKMYDSVSENDDLEYQSEIIQPNLTNGLVTEMNGLAVLDYIEEAEMQDANEINLNQIESNEEINFLNSEPLIFENSKFHGASFSKESCSLEAVTSDQKCTFFEAKNKVTTSESVQTTTEFLQHEQKPSNISTELENEPSHKMKTCEISSSESVLKSSLDQDASSSNVSEDGGWSTVGEEDDEMSGKGNINNDIHSKK